MEIEVDVLKWMSYGMIAVGLATAVILVCCIPAPYGRYSSPSWGWLISSRSAWLIQESPALIIPLILWYLEDFRLASKLVNKVLVSAFLVHYTHRTLIYPLLMKSGKTSPFLPFCIAFVFCCLNGYLQGRYLLHFAKYPTSWLTSPLFITGIVMFVCGMAINIHSDHILRSLRSKTGDVGYKIPYGGLFKYVSGANFFGEIVEWFGFAVACSSLPAAAFAIFTLCNIGPRALSHHRWYHQKFDNYPRDRKALIPFIL